MNVIAWMACEPGFDPRIFVLGVVARNQRDREPGRYIALEVIKKREKFLVTVAVPCR